MIGANIKNKLPNNVHQKDRHTMQLKGLKFNQFGRLVNVKNEISKNGIPKISNILKSPYMLQIVLWLHCSCDSVAHLYTTDLLSLQLSLGCLLV